MGSDIIDYGFTAEKIWELHISEGKTMVIRLTQTGSLNPIGCRTLVYEVQGNRCETTMVLPTTMHTPMQDSPLMANLDIPLEIDASIRSKVLSVLFLEGARVDKGQPLALIEAIKIETTITDYLQWGYGYSIRHSTQDSVQSGQLLIRLFVAEA